ncbi:MAG: enamine deaminase RidA [Rhodospirillaceae bacterium]|jgi:enamine deaminase RidA (YjgF/YER057c/UK114 family)|uniref:RidA family protein n=1 Tax=unclassified Hwanghaeella TaxID=2605944 RepID=UPI000C3EC166|nr:enamine deaminase RidA [Rhodospirillales bacterium]MAX47334.1 enamine deaminase RidA [Rhodospirillaceae bacterium]|tara:strand:- start:201 stop:584 length:384 start_codon:yes stop_codon:yes gene_type:complete
MTIHNPDSIAAPVGAYVHGLETAPGARILHVSGQIGMAKDGTIPAGTKAQSELVWQNIAEILASAGMEISDIVKMTAYLLGPEDLADYGAARTAALAGHKPTSTLIFVAGLVKPELRVEVEVVAAKA